MDNILAIKQTIVEQFKSRRKEKRLSQALLAERSGVSLGSLKRFERLGEISLASLLWLAQALNCEKDFTGLFHKSNIITVDQDYFVYPQERMRPMVWA